MFNEPAGSISLFIFKKPLSGYKKPPKGFTILKPRQRFPTLAAVWLFKTLAVRNKFHI